MFEGIKNKLNFCAPLDEKGEPKPDSFLYELFCFIMSPIPWDTEPCWCCAGVRGLVLGFLSASVFWLFLWWLF